jgi:hypothetical protein
MRIVVHQYASRDGVDLDRLYAWPRTHCRQHLRGQLRVAPQYCTAKAKPAGKPMDIGWRLGFQTPAGNMVGRAHIPHVFEDSKYLTLPIKY